MHSGVITAVFVKQDSLARYNIAYDDGDKETKVRYIINKLSSINARLLCVPPLGYG